MLGCSPLHHRKLHDWRLVQTPQHFCAVWGSQRTVGRDVNALQCNVHTRESRRKPKVTRSKAVLSHSGAHQLQCISSETERPSQGPDSILQRIHTAENRI